MSLSIGDLPISKKVSALVVGLSLAAIGSTAYFSHINGKKIAREGAVQTLLSSTALSASQFALGTYSAQEKLMQGALEAQLQELFASHNDAQIAQALQDIAASIGADWVHIVDAGNVVRNASDPSAIGTTLSGPSAQMARAAQASAPVAPQVDLANKSVIAGMRLRDMNGAQAGAIVAGLPIGALPAPGSALEGYSAWIVSSSGQSAALGDGQISLDDGQLAATVNTAAGASMTTSGGAPVLTAAAPLAGLPGGFSVVSALPEVAALSPLYQKRASFLYLALSGLLIAGLGLWMAHRVSAPLRRLGQAGQKLIDGDTTVDVDDLAGSGEIGSLAQLVTTMRSSQLATSGGAHQIEALAAALESTKVASLLVGPDHTIICANSALRRLLGDTPSAFNISADDVADQSIWAFLGEETALRAVFEDPDVPSLQTEISVEKLQLELQAHKIAAPGADAFGYIVEVSDAGHARTVSGMFNAVQDTSATASYDLNGKLLSANDCFLKTMGYTQRDISSLDHGSFAASKEIWARLRSGEQVSGRFPYRAKGDGEVYLDATYTPIKDGTGKPYMVIQYARDITALETSAFDNKSMIEAINKAQSVIECDPQGRVTAINANMLGLLGKSEREVVGQPHSALMENEFATSSDYAAMWSQLRAGKHDARVYRHRGAGGRTICLQGAFTPVLDRAGTVAKVVGCLADVTQSEEARSSQGAKAEQMSQEQQKVFDKLSDLLKALAAGDLTIQFADTSDAAYKQLATDFNTAIGRLSQAISYVVQNADGIQNEAAEISRAADDLSRRTESQAATLEQTSAALEELTSSVKSAAEGAEKASKNVNAAKTNAEESGAVVDEAIEAMSAIENSSRQISQIIGVIDDIAFQTNLLALNAGVEAARAGDAGRGFAVVASEVRALALRSSEAAKEIKSLISTSSEQVGSGVELVGKTGNALKEIVESVTGISVLVEDIANTAKEQSAGIAEINTAVNQIDQVTQQNTAMVEESTAASHSMMQEAQQLAKHVKQFKVASAPSPAASVPPAQVRRDVPPPAAPVRAPVAPAPSAAPPPPARPQPTAPAPKAAAATAAPAIENHEDDWDEF